MYNLHITPHWYSENEMPLKSSLCHFENLCIGAATKDYFIVA